MSEETKTKEQPAKGEAAQSKASFEIHGITPGVYHFAGYGEIDLTIIPPDQVCEKLVKQKFPYIRKK